MSFVFNPYFMFSYSLLGLVLACVSLALAIRNHKRLTAEEPKKAPDDLGMYHSFEHQRKNDIIIEPNGIVLLTDWTFFYDHLTTGKGHPIFCDKLTDFCFANCPHFRNAIYFKLDKTPVFHCAFLSCDFEAREYKDRRKVVVETEESEEVSE